MPRGLPAGSGDRLFAAVVGSVAAGAGHAPAAGTGTSRARTEPVRTPVVAVRSQAGGRIGVEQAERETARVGHGKLLLRTAAGARAQDLRRPGG